LVDWQSVKKQVNCNKMFQRDWVAGYDKGLWRVAKKS
jgi:hypothetical protein